MIETTENTLLKNARRKLEGPMAPAMPCKRQPSLVKTSAKPKVGNEDGFKTMKSCMAESHESTRQRAESVQSKNHEDHIAGKGCTSMSHNLAHKFIPPQAVNIPDAKAAVDKEWKKLVTIPAWDLEKVESKKEVLEAQRDNREVHCATLMDIYQLKMCSKNQNCRTAKAESCSGETL